MQCSKCGSQNPAGKRFCGDCGAPLANRCARCGAENPSEKKFCGDCGAALATTAAPSVRTASDAPSIKLAPEAAASPNLEGERKTVTALFADIKGSMDLMEDLDPEEARAIVDPALKLMIDAVHRYDGYIVQSTGDGIFALFGAPLAHEDHPQRALYAALRMQDEMGRYSTKLREAGNPPIEARVGVNTGEAVVRSIKTGAAHTEYTPIGHSTSLASRMQTLAPTGSIAVTEATQKLCAGYFNFKALGPTRVKGVTEPVNVFEVTGLGPLRTRLQRAAGRGLTKFVGRQREIDAMKHAAEKARAGHGQIVAAVAEAGVGKSRLFFEFKAIAQSAWMVLETFSVSHGKATAYLPLIELLNNYFNIAAEDDERRRREKVAGRLAILDPSFEQLRPYIFALLGISEAPEAGPDWEHHLDRLEEYLQRVQQKDSLAQMDPQVQQRRTLDAIKRILIRESLNQPLMVIFEDLHWIDDETQSFINLLADSLANARILLLVNYRPEYSHHWHSRTYYTQLRLDPLARESAEEMLTALVGDSNAMEQLKRVIIEKTEGNPFFMEETVQVLLDEGALIRNGAIHLTKPIGELKIPPTVQGILTARIDRLPADTKDLLQTLSVIGREFRLSLIQKVVAKPAEALDRMLNELQLGEFIYEQPAMGDTEYIFKHALTQEVAYNSVLMERRRQLHRKIALALEDLYRDRLHECYPLLARHYSNARDASQAVRYLMLASSQAGQRAAFAEAIDHSNAALAQLQLLPNPSDCAQQELAIRSALADYLAAAKGPGSPEVEQNLIRARQLSTQVDDLRLRTQVLLSLIQFHLATWRASDAVPLLEETAANARQTGDPELIALAQAQRGFVLYVMGDFAAARIELEPLADASEREDLSDRSAARFFWRFGASGYMAWLLWLIGYPDRAVEKMRRLVSAALAGAEPNSLSWVLFADTVLQFFLRNSRATQLSAERARGVATEHGLVVIAAWSAFSHGWALTAQDSMRSGLEEMQDAARTLQEIRSALIGRHYVQLAEGYGKSGESAAAIALLDEGLTSTRKRGDRYFEPEILRCKGEIVLQHGRESKEAERAFRAAIEIAQAQQAKSWELRATTSLARLLRDTNRRDEARAMLANIYNWFTEGFDTSDLIEAKALLAELGG